MNLVASTDPILKTAALPFEFGDQMPVNPIELYNDMAKFMLEKSGLGLSANQVGLPYRFFVMRAEEVIGCFNPKIVDFGEQTVYMDEGCLSFPGLFIKVKRPANIKVRYTEPNGNTVTRKFSGMSARIFQHELDHLDGVTYKQRASKIHLERAERAKHAAKKTK